MDRNKIIGRIRGPFPDGNLTWKFEGHRKPSHSLKTVVGRRYVLKFDPASRAFKVRCYRRLSKRNKKEAVESAKGMVAYLKARLLPADVARCIAASITRERPTPMSQVLTGFQLSIGGKEAAVTNVNLPMLP